LEREEREGGEGREEEEEEYKSRGRGMEEVVRNLSQERLNRCNVVGNPFPGFSFPFPK